jgi:hypothetical protein
MAYTQADLDALDADIAKVRLVKSTTFGDQSTTFRDLDELLKLRAIMAASVSGNRTRYAATKKGV